ncbi:MAG TPA: hypothetical protein VEI94_06155 [Candidatus Bathyarchaeia archaeon]|nr:hypothetical protein [Candidatus Bathyarchaeia archaeon]
MRDAPPWMRELASEELHIGGFTNVQLEHPVIDLSELSADRDAERALDFFLAACIERGAGAARVRCGRGARGRRLIARAASQFKPALVRIDGDNVALMRYFDVYLKAGADLTAAAGARIAATLENALAACRDDRENERERDPHGHQE